ncbi:peripheral-type benzodiazepine receptor-associated protein 1 isoform X12 [Aquila chrysaetos chrysaetos]|uniref:peripheral-type benzodiazepine receptor-associated protein 1 isoform X12 n=1 Tax=Aquila chrysaetos chrysaetos TaxID=223781 RepID=UPI00117700FE|nr:peripheral-type benzodiazepine receptor-associated protein 1 isoform X12 [Aquila chrysaetos chrysaetos]
MQEPEPGVSGAYPPQPAAGQSGAPAAGDPVPAASACPDLDTRKGVGGDSDGASCQPSPGPEGAGAARPQEEPSGTLRGPPADPQRVRSTPELVRPLRAMDGVGRDPTDRPPQSGADYGFLVSQNTKLLSALEDLRHRCSSLAEENSLLRRSCFPQTEEKVKHLKRKNAELAVIAKRLEERARKLQEANLKVVTAPVPLKGSSLDLCKKAFACQRAKDLTEQASALLAKDKQIEALQQECRELQAKLIAGKDDPRCLNVIEFDRLLRESQREVLRLQRQIALKNFKECLRSSKISSGSALPSTATCLGPPVPMLNTCIKGSPLAKEARLGGSMLGEEAHREVEPAVQPLGPASEGHENFPPKNAITDQESSQQIQQLEFELKKKRKKCENLEHEVRKKHKRCQELEIQLQEVQSENARLAEENLQLNEKAEWAGQVESENADLRLQVVLVTKERDSVIQTNQGLQTKLENLEQVLKHMRNVAERRQQLEVEHKEALLVLQEKQEEVRRLQQAQAEAEREHEGAVQLLESTLDCMQARVKDLEDQCRSQTEQFSLLSQELKQFRLQTGKIDLLTSTLVTSELPLALCSSTPQPHWEKESTVPGLLTHQSAKKVHNEETDELESSQWAPDATLGSPVAATGSQKQVKKVESQSNSSKSESMQNSPKSCPTPEVDTASEMEELDVDSISLMPEPGSQGPAKLQVFLARYSYNPFDGPNENPEAELPLTAGEYIYIYGDVDEDGFFEGELMDGRRGLVPSNFVERVSDDDLMTFLPSELNDLTHSSYQEKSFVSASTSSGDKSDFSIEESSISPLASRAEGDQEEPVSHTAVPYPRKLTLIKQLARSVVVGWEPPLLPAGCPDVQSYNIYVDEELRQNVKSGFQTKAVIEKLDLKTKAYRVSVQSVTEQGSSDKLRCTFFVGQDFCVAPTMLKVRSVTATSAEVMWLPCNSNYNHAVYLNGEECDITKPGVYWYTFRNLQPSTRYVAKLEARPLKTPWEEVPEAQEQNSAVIHFTTPLAGTPDAPLDVQVEAGPSPGILVISWLPVTIDAEGSSNGIRVTGYAVYADGQKVIEVTSPTAGSVLVDLSQLQMFQVCREVSVRTMSLYGESVDSVPAQISSVLLRASHHSSPSDAAVSTTFTSRLPHGEPRGSLPGRSPPTHQMAALLLQQKVPTDSSDAKLTDLSSSHDSSVRSLPEKTSSPPHISSPSASLVQALGTSPQGSDAAQDKKCLTVPPQQAGSTVLPGEGMDPVPSREAELQGLGKGTEVQMEQSVTKAPELESLSDSSLKICMETCHACSVEESPKGPNAEKEKEAKEKHLSPEPPPSPSQAEGTEGTFQDASMGGSSCQEFVRLSSGKEVMKEISRVKKEQEEKTSEMGRRQLTLFAEHNRSSDLSDILEEEEEDELSSEALEEKKWDQRESCYQENGEKASGNKDPRGQELSGAAAWQAPSRRGNKSVRRNQMQKPLLSSLGPPRSTASETSVEDDGIRVFVALFDYDPVSMSPNPDAAEEELPFKEGQILKVCGDKDGDGFYRGECAGREGYIPCNMVSEVQVENNEIKKQLLKQGFLPADTPMESIGNGTFSPPPRRQTVPPPKPRRSKKAGLDKQEKYKSHPGQKHKDFEAELLTPRSMVAVFDYNPKESSPNADVEAELTFSAGDIITVFGSMDDDGFYYGELNQQRGLVPSNFLEAVTSDGGMVKELHSKDKEAFPLSAESQLNPDGSVQSDSSPTPPTLPPSCLVTGEQCPEQASLAALKCSDVPGQSKKKRGFFFKGKKLFKKLGSSKKN